MGKEALGFSSKTRVALYGPVIRTIFASDWLRSRVATGRSRDMERGLDEGIAALLSLEDRIKMGKFYEMSPRAARGMMEESTLLLDAAPPAEIDVRDTDVQGAQGPLAARVYSPPGLSSSAPGLVYYHGGGMVVGSLDTHDRTCRRVATRGHMRVIAVDYRLAPEHPFPAPTDDAIAAFTDIAKRASSYGIDPMRLGVGGDSAGGTLSAVVSLATRTATERPRAQLLIYPAVDATMSAASHSELADGYLLTRKGIEWFYNQYLGSDAEKRLDTRASPIREADLSGAPPAIVVTAGFDPLKDEGAAYANKLEAAGVQVLRREHPSLVHGFCTMSVISKVGAEAVDTYARDMGNLLRGL